MDASNDKFRLPTPEEMEKLQLVTEELKQLLRYLQWQLEQANAESQRNVEIQPDIHTEIANKNRPKVRMFQPKPLNKQAVIVQRVETLKAAVQDLLQRIEDTLLVTGHKLMQDAIAVHEAFREASKTNPELLSIVEELDELRRQAEEEQAAEEEA